MPFCNDPRPTNANVSNNEPNVQNEPSVAVNPLSDHISFPGQKSIVIASNDFVQFGSKLKNRIGVYFYHNNTGDHFSRWTLEPPEDFDIVSDPSIDSFFRPKTDLPYINFDDEIVGLFLIAAVTAKDSDNPRDGTIVVYLPFDLRNNASFFPFNFYKPIIVSPGYANEIHNDKPNLALDKSGGSPYLGRAYISYTRYFNNKDKNLTPDGHTEIFFQRSENYGLSWSNPIRLSEPFNRLSRVTINGINPLGTSGKTLLFTNNTITYDGSSNAVAVSLEAADNTSLNFKITIDVPSPGPAIYDNYTVGVPYNNHGLSFEIYRAYGFNQGDKVSFPLNGHFPSSLTTPYPKNYTWGSNNAVGPEGQVYAGWIEIDEHSADPNFQTASFNVRRSDDGGITFNPIVSVAVFNKVPDPLDPPVNPVPPISYGGVLNLNVLTQANLGVDTSTGDFKGRVYAVWHQVDLVNISSTGIRPNFVPIPVIKMSFSDDKGVTWSEPRIISPVGNRIYSLFPSITVSRNTGRVGIVFYSNGCTNDVKKLDVLKVEWDGDIPNDFASVTHVLTQNSFDPTTNPQLREGTKKWIGDYIGAATVPPDEVFAVWTRSDTVDGGTNDELFSTEP